MGDVYNIIMECGGEEILDKITNIKWLVYFNYILYCLLEILLYQCFIILK